MSILFDIGANIGLYSLANLDRFDYLVLIEANEQLIPQLKNLNQPKFFIENCIVSSDPNAKFYVSNANTISTCDTQWMNNSRFSETKYGTYYWNLMEAQVPVRSIDSFVEKYGNPTFIKIDVEGYELNVIKSMTKKYCPIAFEWAEEKQSEIIETLDYLYLLGFNQFFIFDKDTYTFFPEDKEYISLDEIKKNIYSLIPSRKELFGMIYCK